MVSQPSWWVRRHASNRPLFLRWLPESGILTTCLIASVADARSHLHAEWLVFEGISVDESGRQHYLDATVAYKRAVLNCIHYLAKFGYTKEQVGIDWFALPSSASTAFFQMPV
jgi:hypothetical protein